MADIRVQKFAKVLVEHSARIVPGDRVLIEATTVAEPLVRELYIQILEKGGHPHMMVALPGMMPLICVPRGSNVCALNRKQFSISTVTGPKAS